MIEKFEFRDLPVFKTFMERHAEPTLSFMRSVWEDLEAGRERTDLAGWDMMRHRINELRSWKGDPPVVVNKSGTLLFDGSRRVCWSIITNRPCPAVVGMKPRER